MRKIFLVAFLVMVHQLLFGQNPSFTEAEMDKYIQNQNWEKVTMLSLDLLTEEPLEPQGYYYSALMLCRETQFAKAATLNAKAFLFGDEKWKNKSRMLRKKIEEIKELIPNPVNLSDINSLTAEQWKMLWELNKANIEAGVNAIEMLLKAKYTRDVVEILDDPMMANQPGIADLRKRMMSINKNIGLSDTRAELLATAKSYQARGQLENAKATYQKMLANSADDRDAMEGISSIENELNWKKAQSTNTVEAYEPFLRNISWVYEKQARAKIVDLLKSEIHLFTQRGEINKAEQTYTKYVQQYRPSSTEKKEFEVLLCSSYFTTINAIGNSKSDTDKRTKLNLYYKARKICELSEQDKKTLAALEKNLN